MRYGQLCTELKLLYVAITRPKKTLIIYDNENKYRKPLQEFWQKQGLIEVVNKDMLAGKEPLPQAVIETLKKDFSLMEASKDDWRNQGVILFKRKFYDSAI